MPGPCAKQIVRATIVTTDGWRHVGTNAVSHPQQTCPRGDMPTGVGYELCSDVCGQRGHAEVQALRAAAHAADMSLRGATVYIAGHSYACESCLQALREAGIESVVFGPPPAREQWGAPDPSLEYDQFWPRR